MCGIAGVYALTDRPPDPAWGPLLTRALRHRGPDGEGVYHDSRVLLAHTRLAIIDLTEGGRQPMHSADGRHVIVLNGEIYNHAEIRAWLDREYGMQFRSRSDTEVFLEALARSGTDVLGLAPPSLEDTLHRLAHAPPLALGMFAFAQYDRATGDLLLGRDRLGKKPLLYVRTPEWFAFASEAAALLGLPFVRRQLDPASFLPYLRYLYVPGPRTLLRDMQKLPPGSVLRIGGTSPERGPVLERYWTPPRLCSESDARDRTSRPMWVDDGNEIEPKWNKRSELVLLDEMLKCATRLRTVSDVPIGVFLSGGIDSNLVLALLRECGHRPIRAFTVGFQDLPDERPLARLGARLFADEYVELVLPADVVGEVPEILRHFGEPLGDSAIVTTYVLAREASRHVKVILNGDGGDELFGGYPRYPLARRFDIARATPGGLRLAWATYGPRPHVSAVLEVFARGDLDEAARRLTSVMTPDQEQALLGDAPIAEFEWPSERRTDASLTDALFDWDSMAYLPDNLLVKVDLASMAHGLENRSPLLDHRLFELVRRLPPSIRAHPFRTKPILRKLAARRLPKPIVRGRKQGFQLPLGSWLRGPLRPWLNDLLGDPQATGSLYRPGALRAELDRFHAGTSDPNAPYRLWGLTVLELWAREFHVEVAS